MRKANFLISENGVRAQEAGVEPDVARLHPSMAVCPAGLLCRFTLSNSKNGARSSAGSTGAVTAALAWQLTTALPAEVVWLERSEIDGHWRTCRKIQFLQNKSIRNQI